MLDLCFYFIIFVKLFIKNIFFVGGFKIFIKIKFLGGKECIILK